MTKAAADSGKKITKEMAMELRKPGISREDVAGILSDKKKREPEGKNVRLSPGVYKKYFYVSNSGDATAVIEKALEAWFSR